jgi:hypothetical protein
MLAAAATRGRNAWRTSPMPVETVPFDRAQHLKTEADIASYR